MNHRNGHHTSNLYDLTAAIAGRYPKTPTTSQVIAGGLLRAGMAIEHGLKAMASPLSRMDTAGGMYLIGVVTGIGFGAAFVLWVRG